MKIIVIVICYLLFSCLLYAQEFGGHPPSQKWKQINTDTVRIIFPKNLDSQANRVAAVVHSLAANQPFSLGNKLYKINIVLQNQTTNANGYVGLGPWRSEFYLTPDPNSFTLGSLRWTDQLAVHEYRHVEQLNNFRNGLSKAAWRLFGEEGLLVATGAAIPNWFFEGDAVYNETSLTTQGRGRLPLFRNGYKSLWLNQKDYNWMKLRNGSLKDYVPDHYQLGYLLVNYGREKYGEDFWTKVTRDASAYKGLFYPFQEAVKKYAGINFKTFRKNAFSFYKKPGEGLAFSDENYKQISDRDDERIATQGTVNQGGGAGIKNIFPVNKNVVTNYYFPYTINSDSLLYLKRSYRKRAAFYIKDGKGEHRLRVKDIALDEQFGYRNGRIVYAAYNPDARWGWKDYSELRMVDVKTGMQKNITYHTKYFSPDISEDGSRVITVFNSAAGNSELHLLSSANGEIIKKISVPEFAIFTDPKFIDDDNVVAGMRLTDSRMQLVIVNLSSGKTESLTPPSYNVVGYPSVDKGMIYFTAAYEGNDAIYAARLKDKKVFKITNQPLGAYYVNARDSMLTWSGFTAEGYQLQQLNKEKISWAEVNPLALQETANNLPEGKYTNYLQQLAPRQFAIKDYKKSTGLLNFHSFRPYYEDPVFTFSVYGENVLNTLQTEVYYLYNQNENTHGTGFNTVFGGLFPYLSGGADFTFERIVPTGNTSFRTFNQLDTRIGYNIPLNLTSGRSFNFLNFGSSYVLRNEFNTGTSKNLPANQLSYLSHFINWSQQSQMARQDIFPKFGYAITVNQRHAITNIKGYQFLSRGSVFLPGLAATHSLVFQGGFQQRDTSRVLFGNRFSNSRGYTDPYLSRMWKASANYHFPLLYPDRGIGNVVYFQRIRANVFYDFTKGYSKNKQVTVDFRSTGAELFFDTKWWNEYPLTFGVRYSHLLDADLLQPARSANQWEIVLPVSIIPR